MDTKRWLALILAIALFFISIGFRFATSVASGKFENIFAFQDEYFEENVIIDGAFDSKIVVLNLSGIIQDLGESSPFNPFPYDHQQFLSMIEQAGEDPTVEAVILNVDSPGGGVVESAQIHEKFVEIVEEYEKPFYVSMGTMAASGGYYISAPADKIFAQPATITGSIGVIMQNINYSKLAEEYGIDFNTIKSGKHKDILSASREMTEEERDILQSIVNEMYDDFVNIVVDRREMDEKTVRKLADGRIYTGKQAKEAKLVDEIGSLDDTIHALMKDQNLEDATVVEYSVGKDIFSMMGVQVEKLVYSKNSDLIGIMSILNKSDSPRAMYLYTE